MSIQDLLTELATTDDPAKRDSAAIALKVARCLEMIPVVEKLLRDPATKGYRSTLIYAVERLETELPHSFRKTLFDLMEDPDETFGAKAEAGYCLTNQWQEDLERGQHGSDHLADA